MSHATSEQMIPCCPPLETKPVCDVLDYHYRLLHQQSRVSVEVIIHARLQRCPGPLALGDLVYSTTLFPGEKVRLFTTDRRTRFTYDSASKVSYRNEQTQEEHYYMSAWSNFMSDFTSKDHARSTNTTKAHFDTHGETSGFLESIFGGPSLDVSGNFNSESTSDFLRELSQHASASHHRAEMGTRAASAVSIGEVQTRSHVETESQDHFESSSREFANPNKCHAVTFYFYRINKLQTVKFTIESIERRVIDPAADTRVTNNPFVSRGNVSAIPAAVLATDKDRLSAEAIGRESFIRSQGTTAVTAGTFQPGILLAARTISPPPLTEAMRKEGLEAVEKQLVAAGLLEKVGSELKISSVAQKKYSFEVTSSLPTPGMFVRGCVDDCNICEKELMQAMELDLEHKKLENEKLKKEIEILEKSQEYRCCPPGPMPEA
ncbi:MAG: hypothetical protein QXJ74_08190 [Nitrososphaera sp.]|uniref:hypothetical protein n=1 Tax=Nitrososphaera sp. TaxID=1971748 RepID=UPI00183267DF|nr:hypothetical protein [Nitrososphaera sp.]NWG36159.1 hypothetical protein [Nitrososphaera sp.]